MLSLPLFVNSPPVLLIFLAEQSTAIPCLLAAGKVKFSTSQTSKSKENVKRMEARQDLFILHLAFFMGLLELIFKNVGPYLFEWEY